MAQVQETEKVRGIDRLRQLRDELRVQAALAQAETRERWEGLEDRWEDLEERLDRLGDASEEAAGDVKEALENLAGELGEGYERIREAVGRDAPQVPGLERIARLHDELRLQIALGRTKAKADWDREWRRLEARWENLRRRLSSVEGASAETASEVRKAARKVVDEIGEGYDRIRRRL